MNPLGNLISLGCTIAIGSLLLTVGLQRCTISNLEDYKAQVEVLVQEKTEENKKLMQEKEDEIINAKINYEKIITDLTTASANELRLSKSGCRPMSYLPANSVGIDAIINYTTCAEWSNGLLDQVQGFTSISDTFA